MNYDFDLMVYIGRFQPLHNGHINTIRLALQSARRVIVLIGSHNTSPSIRNPFTTEERMALIRASLDPEEYDRCLLAGLEDYTYNDDLWIKRIKEIVQGFNAIYGTGGRIGITGFDKDSTTYYLKLFPDWQTSLKPQTEIIDATKIRECFFDSGTILTDMVPKAVSEFMINLDQERLTSLRNEWNFVKGEKAKWANTPFPVTFNTVDCVIRAFEHILLIRRGSVCGKGLLALPGGYIEQNETLFQGALRELEEETGLEIQNIARFPPKDVFTFDDPKRSERGRIITTAFYFHLPLIRDDLNVKGADDAESAEWVYINNLKYMRSQFFEDHYHIINYFLNKHQ